MLNIVVLHGHVTRAPEERALPSGDRLVTFDLTVPAGDKRAPVNVAWFGAPDWIMGLADQSELVVVGHVRRRFFRAGERLESRTEVVVEAAAPARQKARVTGLLGHAAAELSGWPP